MGITKDLTLASFLVSEQGVSLLQISTHASVFFKI